MCFNSRTREGCDITEDYIRWGLKFQFTHPRGVRFGYDQIQGRIDVSIHAPARGAMPVSTGYLVPFVFQFTHPRGVRSAFHGVKRAIEVSIHAPARGAIRHSKSDRRSYRFNSRTREGCDVDSTLSLDWGSVSIHAPARGAIYLIS